MVLLNAGNDRQKLYEELVIFMNSPEVAEHFVVWLFGEVEKLQQVQLPTVTAAESVPMSQVQFSQAQVTQTYPEHQVHNLPTVTLEQPAQEDVQMSSGSRLQGTRNFTKALESVVSTNSTRKTFSEDPNGRLSERYSRNERSERLSERYDRDDRNERSGEPRSYNESRYPRDRSPNRNSRRVIRSSAEEGGKVQKIKLSVDFDREERSSVGGRRTTAQKSNFKKIDDNSESASNSVIKVKCQYWPNCRAGDACPNVHPTETCKNFPNCQFGDSCTFVHPSIPCKFQEKCQNPLCNYQHRPMAMSHVSHGMSTNPSLSTILCKFYPRCVNINCPYLHPVKVQCRYGFDCSRPDCPFEHPTGRKGAHLKSVVFAPCKYGKQCARADCPYQHENTGESVSETIVTGDAVMDISSTVPTPQVQ